MSVDGGVLEDSAVIVLVDVAGQPVEGRQRAVGRVWGGSALGKFLLHQVS